MPAARQLVNWFTHPQNNAFGRAVANRGWDQLFGRRLGELIEDVHDVLDSGVFPSLGKNSVTRKTQRERRP